MRLPIYIANAFTTTTPFSGNPAAVIPLDAWLPVDTMQAIAQQNNLAETAFVVVHPDERGNRPLRWFTPAKEVSLCGHATLATAFVLGQVLQFEGEDFGFSTLSGELRCQRKEEQWTMDFPADLAEPTAKYEAMLAQILGADVQAEVVLEGRDDVCAVLAKAEYVRHFTPDFRAIATLGKRGLIVTALDPDGPDDVVSRCFYPAYGIDEDAATGSAHTLIGPYWCKHLGQNTITCHQASARGAELDVRYENSDRVLLSGKANLYLHGEIKV